MVRQLCGACCVVGGQDTAYQSGRVDFYMSCYSMETPVIKYLGLLAHTELCMSVTFSMFNVQAVSVG